MKKRRIALVWACILCIAGLNACSGTTEELLAFDDNSAYHISSAYHRLARADYFSGDLVTVSQEGNSGEDSELTSGACLLVNCTDQKLIYAEHVYDRLYPASLTKLMTALVVLKHGELTDSVTVSYDASHITEAGAKLCGFEEGDVLSMETLLNSLLVYSGNDAAVAIADHVGGSTEGFAKLMNEEAKELGAVHTNFINPSGLHDDKQYTTAYDVYLIFNELLHYDTFRSLIATDSYTASYQDKKGNPKEKTYKATNQYLTVESEVPEGITVVGGKTGTTSKAGNCLVLLSKNTAGKEYISVILKAENSSELYSQMSHLLSIAVK